MSSWRLRSVRTLRAHPSPRPSNLHGLPDQRGRSRWRYIRGSATDADTTQIDGYLPPPVPTEALGALPLDAVSAFTVAVKPSSVSDAVDLREAGGYVLATVNEVGALKASVRPATSSLPIRPEGLFRGDVYAFSFEPLWRSVASDPQLWVRDADKEDIVHGTLALPIARAPVWAHSVRLPMGPSGPVIRFAFDLEVTQNRLLPLLVYPSRFSQPWSAAPFRARCAQTDGFASCAAKRARGAPYTVSVSSLDTTKPEAYLVLLRL